jgi:hypothetical protein
MNLITAALYDPAVAVTRNTTGTLAMTAFDTTNLRLSFTGPTHGFVRVRMHTVLSGATTFPSVHLGILQGATVRARVAPTQTLGNTAVATAKVALDADFVVPGVTGSVTWDAAYGVDTGIASTAIRYGGPDNTVANDAWGAFVFEVWDARPTPLAVPGGSGGLFIAGSNALTSVNIIGNQSGTISAVAGLVPSRLDVDVSTRLATSGYTAPDNASVTAIKAKTDNLPAAPAAVGDIPTASQNATAVISQATTTPIVANVKKMNDTDLTGNGSSGTPWGPA